MLKTQKFAQNSVPESIARNPEIKVANAEKDHRVLELLIRFARKENAKVSVKSNWMVVAFSIKTTSVSEVILIIF